MKKAISLTSIGLCLLLFLSVLTLPVHAYSYTLETCPHSEGMPTDYLRKKLTKDISATIIKRGLTRSATTILFMRLGTAIFAVIM
ncbi:hypothetical protein MR730_01245 [bacterium]|nr:hypothetical protein [bacterium]